MTNPEPENGTTRDELVQRLALMETMIAEGRRATVRFGWVFVLWGSVDIAGMVWQLYRPHWMWVWPVTMVAGFILQFTGMALRRRTGKWCSSSLKSRSISAVWGMMGVTLVLYCFSGMFSNHAWQASYIAAIFIIVGMAHAISAVILRWGMQAFIAAVWWAGGIAAFLLVSSIYFCYLFIAEMFFGMVVFGLYSMWLEQRGPGGEASAHV